LTPNTSARRPVTSVNSVRTANPCWRIRRQTPRCTASAVSDCRPSMEGRGYPPWRSGTPQRRACMSPPPGRQPVVLPVPPAEVEIIRSRMVFRQSASACASPEPRNDGIGLYIPGDDGAGGDRPRHGRRQPGMMIAPWPIQTSCPIVDPLRLPPFAELLVNLRAKEILVGPVGDLVLRDPFQRMLKALSRALEAMAQNLPIVV
jgi:hypothetical protein